MAPAFDRRSMETYAPIITGVTSELLAGWDILPNSSEVDVGAAMYGTPIGRPLARTRMHARARNH
jgi:cytochrome P450